VRILEAKEKMEGLGNNTFHLLVILCRFRVNRGVHR
jgi:hypothetical protein